MTPFPVIDSTLSPPHLAEWLKEKYALGSAIDCRLFCTHMNHTYFVTAPNRNYVLRIYSYGRRSETEISEELRLLDLLKHRDISVSYPIADRNGGYIQRLDAPEGTRYAVLFSFGEGNKVRFLSKSLCQTIGGFMANVHQVTVDQTIERIHYAVGSMADNAYRKLLTLFPESLEEVQFVKAAGKMLGEVFEAPLHKAIRKGVVHLDIWYDNMSINDEGNITLFDFDNCGNGWLVLDVGYFCLQLFHIENDKEQYQKKKAKFLEGYREKSSLSEQEMALIPYAGLAIWIFYLGVQVERFDNFANIFLSENYLKMYLGKVKDWLRYHDLEVVTSA